MTVATVALSALGALAASIAAIAALKGLGYARVTASAALDSLKYARETVELGEHTATAQRHALDAAQATIQLADRARRVAELERQRRRLERVSQLAESVFWNATNEEAGWATGAQWMEARNQLSHALVGLQEELPECTAIVGQASAPLAKMAASRARSEVETRLADVQQRIATLDAPSGLP